MSSVSPVRAHPGLRASSSVEPPLTPEYLRALPKAEVHCHLEGSVPPEMAVALARKNGVRLPTSVPEELYRFADLEQFLVLYVAVSRAMQTSQDFEMVTYSSLCAAAEGGLRYREIAFNPSNHPDLSYPDMLAGILAGARAAEQDAGVVSRIIVAINRELGGHVARDLIREVIAHRVDEVAGIGLDHNELAGPPAMFQEAYALARDAGLSRTAHAGERGDAGEVSDCLDLLKVDRIDHGYAALLEPNLLSRCVDSQVPFATCWLPEVQDGWVAARAADLGSMLDAGLNVSLSSDDPGVMAQQIADDFVEVDTYLHWSREDAEKLSLAGIDASFADAGTKDKLRAEFTAELERLRPMAHTTDVSPAPSTQLKRA